MTTHTPHADDTPKLALDLTRYMAKHDIGDITAIMTWTMHNQRPCIVLIPTFVPTHNERITPCIVPLDNAWIWDEVAGDGAHCANATYQFACSLGFNPTPRLLIRITSIIRELLGDLLSMPPMPRFYDPLVVADATLTNLETGKVTQSEVTEHV